MTPKVSICMPVFNGGHYFKAALESALAQEYDNLEIVVVNDGSTDGGETERIALAYGDRVRYFHQPNRGVAGAMNTAVVNMTGDFFAWLSHDDLHLPHKTAAQVAFLGRLGRPHACLFSDFDLIGPEGEPITSVRLPVKSIRQNPRLPLYNGMINGCTLLIPAKILREFGPFDEALRCTQDYDVWNRILAGHEFFHQPEVLIRYRIHPGQGTNTPIATSEGDVLWKAMLASRNEVERVQMFGSTRRYFESLAKFLDVTPYKGAAADAHIRAANVGREALVSVVIPFHNQVDLTLRAVRSALDQTHRQVEILLVDNGSTEEIAPLTSLAASESRLRLLRQAHIGPAAARNKALGLARGDYIAFLDAVDRFTAHKIERQLEQMQRHGALFSHTSNYVTHPKHTEAYRVRHSGRFGGSCYPEIIRTHPIALSTVMLHRSLVDGGFTFPIELRIGDDMLAWIDLATCYKLLGIDEPLSIVTWADACAALDPAEQVLSLSCLTETLQRHPIHYRYYAEIETLRQATRAIARRWVAADRQIEAVKAQDSLVEEYSPAHPAFPAGGNGRVLSAQADIA
jgi:glycosyltransferase involved in cell wall biosynthesis